MRTLLFVFAALASVWASSALAFAPTNDARATALAHGLPLTPQMFGARGDGRSDDTHAIAAWLTSGKPLFCSGTFRISDEINVDVKADGGLYLQGAGRQLCKFVLATPQSGLSIHGGTPDIYDTPQIVLHDFSLAPAAIIPHPALQIAFSGGSGATDPTLDLRNIAIKPVAQSFFAAACLHLTNARNGVVQAVNCEGHRGLYEPGSRGVIVDGNAQPVELTLRDINTYFMEVGIALEGTWQGVSVEEVVCVPCRVGVSATASDNNGVWLRVLDSHFNVEDIGVETVNIANVHVVGTYTYLHNGVGFSRSPYRACISATMLSQATMWAKISGNSCDGTQAAVSPKYGVFIDSTRKPASFLMEDRVEGNSFYTLDWGVYLKNTTSVDVGANTYAFVSKGDVYNGSNGSGIFKNTEAPHDEPLKPGGN